MPESQRKTYEKLTSLLKHEIPSDNWTWKSLFRSKTMELELPLTKEDVFAKLDAAFADIMQQEKEIVKAVQR